MSKLEECVLIRLVQGTKEWKVNAAVLRDLIAQKESLKETKWRGVGHGCQLCCIHNAICALTESLPLL